MKKFKDLYDFIDRAIKSRKYPENTGISLKTALKLFENELKEQELNSIDEFRKNIDQIYQSVFVKNKNFSAGSLATYKSRVIKTLNDYEKYGVDATKMANWTPKIITRSKKQYSPKIGDKKMEEKTYFTEENGSFHTIDFIGGVKLLIPKTNKMTKAMLSGDLNKITIDLENFSNKNKEEKILENNEQK